MTIVHLMKYARHALVAIRKATVDALLLTAFILLLLLVFTGMLFTYTWLILPIYALALLLTLGLRMHQGVRDTTVLSYREHGEIGQILYAGVAEPLQTATFRREQSGEQVMELTSRTVG